VVVKDPLVTTDLPLPKTDSSDVTVQATVENVSDKPVKGARRHHRKHRFERQVVELAPHSTQQVTFDAKNTPALHMEHPRLWWPNGYGAQNLYTCILSSRLARPSPTRRMWTSACARSPTAFPAPTR
jgi:hypothetical protein